MQYQSICQMYLKQHMRSRPDCCTEINGTGRVIKDGTATHEATAQHRDYHHSNPTSEENVMLLNRHRRNALFFWPCGHLDFESAVTAQNDEFKAFSSLVKTQPKKLNT